MHLIAELGLLLILAALGGGLVATAFLVRERAWYVIAHLADADVLGVASPLSLSRARARGMGGWPALSERLVAFRVSLLGQACLRVWAEIRHARGHDTR